MGFNDINIQVSGPVQPTATYKTKVLKGQVPFATQVTEPNTKYVIKHNFVLNGDVTIPENCILEFDGGSISGEHTITGQNTGIEVDMVKIFNTDVTLAGTWNVAEVYPEWFGAKGDGINDDTTTINKCINSFNTLYLKKNKNYKVTEILVQNGTIINGNNAIITYIGINNLFNIDKLCEIKNLRIYIPDNSNSSIIFNFKNSNDSIQESLSHQFRRITNILIYATERHTNDKSNIIGFNFAPDANVGSGGISWVIVENTVCKFIDTFCKISIPEGTNAWVNANKFLNCVAHSCGCAIDFGEGGIIEGNTFNIDFQRGAANENRPVNNIPYSETCSNNIINGYIWDSKPETHPYLSVIGNNVETITTKRLYCGNSTAILLGLFPNMGNCSVELNISSYIGYKCSILVRCINGTVSARFGEKASSDYSDFVLYALPINNSIALYIYSTISGGVTFGLTFTNICMFSVSRVPYPKNISELNNATIINLSCALLTTYPIELTNNDRRIATPIKYSDFNNLTQSGIYCFRASLKQLNIANFSTSSTIIVHCFDSVYNRLDIQSENLSATTRVIISNNSTEKWKIKWGIMDKSLIYTDNIAKGSTIFDTVLEKPIWWNGSAWVDATGTPV